MKALLFLVLTLVLAAPASVACRCMFERSVEEEYRAVDVVVKATMIKKEVFGGPGTDTLEHSWYKRNGWTVRVDTTFQGEAFGKYTFTLLRVYKGQIRTKLVDVVGFPLK